MIMTTTIQQALRPLFITCFSIGLCIYPLNSPKSQIKWIVYLSILYSATVWFIYVYLWYYLVSSLSLKAVFPYTISITIVGISIITAITSTILNMYYNEKLQICMKKITAVDDTLKALGSPKIYKKMHTWSKRVVIGWIVCIFVLNFNDSFTWLILLREKNVLWKLIIPYMHNYSHHVNTLVDSVFIIFLWHIGIKFDEINEHMQNMIKKEHLLRNTWKKPTIIIHQCTLSSINYKRVLWSLMHLHLELCRIAREWNLIFGMQITFETACYPLFITSLCFYLYKMLTFKYYEILPMSLWFDVFLWMFVSVGKVYLMNYVCENVCVKANKIDKIINELTLQYSDVSKEIYQFTLQTMHHPLRFTGMGFFSFGNEYFIKLCVTITMFVVIMVQMSDPTSMPKDLA